MATKFEPCPLCGSYWAVFTGKKVVYSVENVEYIYSYKCNTCVTEFEKILIAPTEKVYA